eukprot:g24373.t1
MASELAVLPRSNAVNLRLQAAKPVFGRHSIDPDKIAVALNNGKKAGVLPVLRHLTSAGKATIELWSALDECSGTVTRMLRQQRRMLWQLPKPQGSGLRRQGRLG